MVKRISNWKELSELPPSDTHHIEVKKDERDEDYNCHYIVPNVKTDKYEDIYLSTHTFYGGEITESYNKLLNKCGFNVKLISLN